MARMCECHEKLNADGVGSCSVPMWSGDGGEAGFCNKVAFGSRPDGETVVRWDGYVYRSDNRYAGYVPGLACPGHGGPSKPETRKEEVDG
jgi:hypothetical protein